jgi:hypothetical protein
MATAPARTRPRSSPRRRRHGADGMFFATPTFQIMHNRELSGRNMFGPIRGAWANDDWKGWRGDNPVYHCDVLVLTHHAPGAAYHGRRHHVPFRHRWNRSCLARRPGRSPRQGRSTRGRSCHGSSLPADWLGLMSCTSRSRRSCSAPENLCSPAAICHRSAVSGAFLRPRRRTLSWHIPKPQYEPALTRLMSYSAK